MSRVALPPAGAPVRERALEVLLSKALEPVVDFVAWTPAPGEYEVASALGSARFRRCNSGTTSSGHPAWEYEVTAVSGENPVARQEVAHLADLDAQRSLSFPSRHDNSYPCAYDHLAQVFDHGSAPDLVVVHSSAHYWGDQGGHLGEHGSLGVVQARAPFIAAGAGIRPLGPVESSCRLVDVAPTILELLGAPPSGKARPAGRLAHQDGTVLAELLSGAKAEHVVAMLLDGTNASVLYHLASRGDAPNVARLMAGGCTYRFGAIASFPTVTLPNHTAVLTGSHPGHHGVLHNAWVDRTSGEQVITNSASTWATAMRWLDPSVETVHQAVHRTRPEAVSVSINEPCDVGADYSVFELVRQGEPVDRPPPADELPDATERFVRPSKDYRWSSRIDHSAVEQFLGIWGGDYRGRAWPLPAFTWVNFTLTDAAFHEGGPYSEIAAAAVRDTDVRIGHLLKAVERAGAWDDTAFLLVADHGMELSNPETTGDWDAALKDAGVPLRDEGYGFLYLTEGTTGCES